MSINNRKLRMKYIPSAVKLWKVIFCPFLKKFSEKVYNCPEFFALRVEGFLKKLKNFKKHLKNVLSHWV